MYRLPNLEPKTPLRRIALLISGGDAPGMIILVAEGRKSLDHSMPALAGRLRE